MQLFSFRNLWRAGALAALTTPAMAEPQHGIAMYGDPALPPDFVSLPYVNPDAPKGGRIVFAEGGGFDSMNPYILKGNAPWGIRVHVVESLMGRSWDEPFTLYCLLCESVETPDDRAWVEFTLREEARFSDGSPVTVDDVLWSFETLGTLGHPRYQGAWKKVASAEATGPRSLRITFNTEDRELPLIMGLRPVLQRAQWEGKTFDESGIEAPIGTGPYVVAEFEPGRFITFRKDPDWWGADLPFNRGQQNLDEIRYDYYADGGVIFEAFRAGESDTYRESSAARWETAYDFPAVAAGDVVRSEIPHRRPSGMAGLVMNTRRDRFADWRVREAMIQAFNYEFISASLNGGDDPRIASYFGNSPLGMEPGPAQGLVATLLAPHAAELLPGAIEGYAFPVSDGSEANRSGTRAALALFAEAGWTVQDGVMKNAAGQPFGFDILLGQGSSMQQSIVDIYVESLGRLGITPTVTVVDSAQYTDRVNAYDFDMTWYTRGLSLSPGNEQTLYFGSAGVTEPGTRNLMGMNSPAAEAMIATMLAARSHDEFVAATHALDRVLTSGRYVIPIWFSRFSRLAHRKELKFPETLPIYGDWQGFLPDIWWFEE